MYSVSPQQLEALAYPNGRGQYHYGGTPVMVSQTSGFLNGVQPGGVSQIGTTPVREAAAIESPMNESLGVQAGQLPATGIPQGAAAGGATGPMGGGLGGAGGAAGAMGGAGGFTSIASSAIDSIAKVAGDYVAAKAQANALAKQQAMPAIPESMGALAAWQPPSVTFRS